jgi:hypothetical protein
VKTGSAAAAAGANAPHDQAISNPATTTPAAISVQYIHSSTKIHPQKTISFLKFSQKPY